MGRPEGQKGIVTLTLTCETNMDPGFLVQVLLFTIFISSNNMPPLTLVSMVELLCLWLQIYGAHVHRLLYATHLNHRFPRHGH